MNHRRLGRSGLKLSEISLGFWATFGSHVNEEIATECLKAAYDGGVDFFDNAEAYGRGESEAMMGRILKKVGWRRSSYAVSTKFFFGLGGGGANERGLSRKYLLEAMDGSLRRLQLEYVDLVFCHRPDLETPIEETVRAMHDLVARGKALYWGTSEWTADQIMEAWQVAEGHHLHKPQMEQPQYNMLHRDRVEKEYGRLYEGIGLGTTIWSPLASGILAGKYNEGVPPGSRLSLKSFDWLKEKILKPEKIQKVRRLEPIALGVGATLAQLAVAWCLKNPNVSTVITGATSAAQVRENLKAAEIAPLLTAEVMEQIEAVLENRPKVEVY